MPACLPACLTKLQQVQFIHNHVHYRIGIKFSTEWEKG
ncbi:hypothetical protein LINPERPRIM_LOCUS17234 [Linum perenne]